MIAAMLGALTTALLLVALGWAQPVEYPYIALASAIGGLSGAWLGRVLWKAGRWDRR